METRQHILVFKVATTNDKAENFSCLTSIIILTLFFGGNWAFPRVNNDGLDYHRSGKEPTRPQQSHSHVIFHSASRMNLHKQPIIHVGITAVGANRLPKNTKQNTENNLKWRIIQEQNTAK
jgi:hypothetical protein